MKLIRLASILYEARELLEAGEPLVEVSSAL